MTRAGRRAAARVVAVVWVLSLAAVAVAQGVADATYRIDPQPVSSALRQFAAQSRVQLIFSEEDLQSLRTEGVNGRLSPRDALEQLLRGTALQFEFTDSDVAIVRKRRDVATSREPLAGPARSSARPTPRVGTALPAEDELSFQEVTVTGSRIARRDLDAKSPLLTVEARAFEESATLGVESVLNQLPQFVPTGTQFVTTDVFPTAINTPGIASLNLRGFATNRTLVLIDGRRAQPANSLLVIDMNSVPSAAISRVEVITGGASAAYGADAMGGVTNVILRDHFEGLELAARGSVTEVGDGAERGLSMLFGSGFGESRGGVIVGVEWTKRSSADLFERPFFESSLTDPGAPATAIRLDYTAYEPNASAGGLPSQAAANALFPDKPANVTVNRSTSFYLNADGTLFKDQGALGYRGEYGQKYKVQPNGALGENSLDELISAPLERYSFLGRAHYAITERLEVVLQGTFANSEAQSVSQPAGATGGFAASIPRDAQHPVPAELAALLDSRGPNTYGVNQFDPITGLPVVLTGVDSSWRLGRVLDFLPPRQLRNRNSVYQLVAGLEGELPYRDWTWDVFGSHGDSKIDNEYIGFASLGRYRAVVTAPFYGKGYTQTGLGDTALSCTSGLPIFEDFEVSQDCIDAITTDLTDRTHLTQDIYEANIQGSLGSLTAGEVRAALGTTFRKNEFEFRPDALRATNSIIDIPVSTFSNALVRGRTLVKEVFGELLLPVLNDHRYAKSLELELGARYSDYDTTGGVPTYKALFSWTPVTGLRFRGGFQLANRAPNINELFLSASSVPINLRGPDPCRSDTRDTNGNHPDNPRRAEVQALCSAIIGTGTSTYDEDPDTFIGDGRTDGGEVELRVGNPDVRSEEGRTWTLGLVFTAPFDDPLLRGLTFSLDGYRTSVSETIALVGAQTTYDLCFNRNGLSNPTYSIDDPNGMCARIVRNGVTGDRQYVRSPFANLGRLRTSGIDLQANWTVTPAELGLVSMPGKVSLGLVVNKLVDFLSQSFPTSPERENAGTLARNGLFSYRALTTLRYALPNFDVMLKWRRYPSVRNANYVTDPATEFEGAESYSAYDLASNWSFGPTLRATIGIENLFDRAPNRVGAGPGNNGAGTTMPGFYDVLGRRYYAGVRVSF